MILRSNLNLFDLKFCLFPIFLISLLILCHHHVKGQSNKVSSKLDFDDPADKNNSSMPIQPGGEMGQQGRGGGSMNGNDGSNSRGGNRGGRGGNGRDDDDDDDSDTNRGDGSKRGPKIHGVRVTVDTGDAKKSKESKESVEITDLGKHKKRVGIHTDITFEITADGADVLNATSTTQGDKDEDASVPVYRGRGGHGHGTDTRHKSRQKPYDPRSRWSPNFSAERRHGYDGGQGRSGVAGSGSYYPNYPSYNIPVYKNSGDATRGAGGSIYRQDDGWNSYVPSNTYWTTERTYSEHYRPNSVSGYQSGSDWKPCYCVTYGNDNRRRRDSNQGSEISDVILNPKSPVIEVIDSKVDALFSKK